MATAALPRRWSLLRHPVRVAVAIILALGALQALLRVHEVLLDLEHYVDWWPQVRAVASAGPDDALVVCRSLLPYDLELHLQQHVELDVDQQHLVDVELDQHHDVHVAPLHLDDDVHVLDVGECDADRQSIQRQRCRHHAAS